MDEQAAWEVEERFWLEGSPAHDALLDPECLVAFLGMGVMRATDVLESLRRAPRLSFVEVSKRAIGRPGAAVLVPQHRAAGRRDGPAPILASCTSTDRRDRDAWTLVQRLHTLGG